MNRRSYTREIKINVVNFFNENGQNYSETSRHFDIPRKNIQSWVKGFGRILSSNVKSRRCGSLHSKFPELEQKLYNEFKLMRDNGMIVKPSWFLTKTKELVPLIYKHNPKKIENFKFSTKWFFNFRKRNNISYRLTTHRSSIGSKLNLDDIIQFHTVLRSLQNRDNCIGPTLPLGQFWDRNFINADEIPLEFDCNGGRTYSKKGLKHIWSRNIASGLEKRQATLIITLFGDGAFRTPPVIVFRGQGISLTELEKSQWDPRVVVRFQKNAWVDLPEWDFYCKNVLKPSINCNEHNVFLFDVHRPHKDATLCQYLRDECNITPMTIPSYRTPDLQPVDVCIGHTLKHRFKDKQIAHLSSSSKDATVFRFSAMNRRILITKWIGEVWEDMSQHYHETVRRTFQKVGITLPSDGSKDSMLNLEHFPHYKMPFLSNSFKIFDPFSD